MLKIVIICLVLSELGSCEIKNLTFADIDQLMVTFNEASDYIEREMKGGNGNAAVVIGTSRSGKSTLINYLMGNKLIAYRSGYQVLIKKDSESDFGPDIGEGSVSVTKNCKSFNSTLFPGLSIWDAAGYQDNRGPVTDIENTFYLHHLVKKAEFLKIILVSYYNDFSGDNINEFIDVLLMLVTLFPSRFNSFFPSISVICSRVPPGDAENPVDYEYIKYVFEETFLTYAPLMNNTKPIQPFVQYLVKHNDHVGIFKTVAEEGTVTSDIDFNVINSINKTYRIKKACRENIGFTFSTNSATALQNIKTEADHEIATISIDLKSIMNTYYDETLKKLHDNHLTRSSLERIKRDLNYIREHIISLRNNYSIEDQIEAIKKVDNSFKAHIETKNLSHKATRVKFITFLLNLEEMKTFEPLNVFVKNMDSNILQLICYCSLLQKELDVEVYQKKINEIRESYNLVIKGLQETLSANDTATNKQFWNDFWKKFPLATKINESVPPVI